MDYAKTLTLVGEMDGCSLWRVLLPLTELQRQGYTGLEWGMREDDRLANYAHRFDAIVLPRLHWPIEEQPKARKWFDVLHRAEIAVLYEMDDDLFSEDFERRLVDHKGYDPSTAKERRGFILDTVRQCDGMTVSSQRLATMARAYVDIPIRVVPNYIDLRWFKKVQRMNTRAVKGLTIGWAGGARPDEDVENMARAWKEIAKRFPDVTFVVMGFHAPAIYAHVPHERIAMLDWLPIESYPAGMLNIDIGCCPLSDTGFNRAKTYIKAMEYAASGAPVVASSTVYNQIIQHGYDGYIAETVDEWVEYLARLIESEKHRVSMARRLLAKVKRDHALEQNAWRWIEAWTDLVRQWKNQYTRPRILLPKGVEYARA